MNIHYRQAAACSGYDYGVVKVFSYLNSQRKRPGDLDILTLKVVSRRVNASGSCSGKRGNVLAVGNYC